MKTKIVAPACRSCARRLSGVWPDTPWRCFFCDAPLCVYCYVDHTDREHFDDLHPGTRPRESGPSVETRDA